MHTVVLMTDKINVIYSTPNGIHFLLSMRTLHIAVCMCVHLVSVWGGGQIFGSVM
jgi:hypothetical protein